MKIIVDELPENCSKCIFRRSPSKEVEGLEYCDITKSLTHYDTIKCNVLTTLDEVQTGFSIDDMK